MTRKLPRLGRELDQLEADLRSGRPVPRASRRRAAEVLAAYRDLVASPMKARSRVITQLRIDAARRGALPLSPLSAAPPAPAHAAEDLEPPSADAWAETIDRLRAMRRQDPGMLLRHAAAELNREGRRTRTGRRWDAQAVRNALRPPQSAPPPWPPPGAPAAGLGLRRDGRGALRRGQDPGAAPTREGPGGDRATAERGRPAHGAEPEAVPRVARLAHPLAAEVRAAARAQQGG